MPVMNEQVRKERTEKLIQLLAEGMSPADAWRVVDPKSKAKGKSAADQTRRDIGWYRERYCVTDSSAGPNGLNGAASLNGAHAEVTEDVAAKPEKATKRVKRCLGVEGKPCEKNATGRSPRCDECRKEHEDLQKKAQNQGSYRRNKEARKERRIRKSLAQRLATALGALLARLQEEEKRRQELEKERQEAERRQREEEERRREAEKKRRQELAEALAEAKRAEEERTPKRLENRMLDDGRSITTDPNTGVSELYDRRTGRKIILQPGEPIPPARGPKVFTDADLPAPAQPEPTSYYQNWVENHRRR